MRKTMTTTIEGLGTFGRFNRAKYVEDLRKAEMAVRKAKEVVRSKGVPSYEDLGHLEAAKANVNTLYAIRRLAKNKDFIHGQTIFWRYYKDRVGAVQRYMTLSHGQLSEHHGKRLLPFFTTEWLVRDAVEKYFYPIEEPLTNP